MENGNGIRENFEIHKKKYMWLLGIAYKIILDIYYVFVISVYWVSDGFEVNPSFVNWFVIWSLYILGYWLMMQVDNQIISFFLHIQWMLTISPVLVLNGVNKNYSMVYPVLTLGVLFVQVVLAKTKKKFIPISFYNGKIGHYVDVTICVVAPLVWLVMAFYNDFAGVKAFDFKYIYEMRSKLVYPPFFGYLVRWVTSGGLLWLLMTGLTKKKIFYVIYSLVLQLLFYMLMGIKGPLFMTVVLIVVFLLIKVRIPFYGIYSGVILGTVIGICGGMIESIRSWGLMLAFNAMLGERTLFFPGMIKHWFYETFSEAPKVYFADGMIGKLLSQTNLYNDRIGHIVYTYINGERLRVEANAGYLADSFAQMGIMGMFVIGILVILLIRFISNYQDYLPKEILYGIVTIFAVTLNDNAFFTSLLTGGFWLLIAFLIINARESQDSNTQK